MGRPPKQQQQQVAVETKMKPVVDTGRADAFEHVRIECPSCGREPNCYKNVRLPDKTRRYYKCGFCGRVFKTVEVVKETEKANY